MLLLLLFFCYFWEFHLSSVTLGISAYFLIFCESLVHITVVMSPSAAEVSHMFPLVKCIHSSFTSTLLQYGNLERQTLAMNLQSINLVSDSVLQHKSWFCLLNITKWGIHSAIHFFAIKNGNLTFFGGGESFQMSDVLH